MNNYKASILTEKEQGFLQRLNEADVEYMIVGLSAAALQGAPVVTQDIDLWFKKILDERITESAKAVGGVYMSPIGHTPQCWSEVILDSSISSLA